MTKFIKENLSGSEFVTYGDDRKFVARFKRGGKASFLSFLVKNFTVEEYFAQLAAGVAPLRILEGKGYVLPHIKKKLVRDGYEPTPAGLRQYIQNQITARETASV